MESVRQCVRGRVAGTLAFVWIIVLAGLPDSARGEEPKGGNGDVTALAERIDRLLAARQAAEGVKPTRPADDAEFLRRVSLDLGGRIPRINIQMQKWLADPSPEKRRQLVERVLSSQLYVEHFTNVWRHLLLPPGNNQQAQALANQFEPWLRKQFRDNVRYDAMVRDLLTTPLAANAQPGMPAEPGGRPTAAAFYQINELKPENLAASASRLFLGVKLECAQCHDHKTASWKRKQFWELAAFFSGIRPQQPDGVRVAVVLEDPKKRTITYGIDNTEVEARYLDGKTPIWKDDVPTRQTLAEWVTAADNPYFARNAVNRLWAHFFGIGIVDPVDEPGPDNPPSHPELLDELARAFVDHQFDVKFIIRAITSTRAYQLSSEATDPSQKDARLFARMTVKGMSGEQLFDSLAEATGFADQAASRGPTALMAARAEFLAKFGNAIGRPTEYQTSILQALSLMNGKVIADATGLDKGHLGAAIDFPFWNTNRQIEELYLFALARKPRPNELERLSKYVDKGGPSGDSRKALADVFWALLNSSEFIFNH